MKIFNITHKPIPHVNNELYTAFQVNSNVNPMIFEGILQDNTLDNIASKNDNYCELTACYWLWKNVSDIDYIGLCHYRRYFNFFPNSIKMTSLSKQHRGSIYAVVSGIMYGLMGYFGISLKPSTILVFSIAFGISVDNAIQFMAKYRHDLIENNGKIKKSVFSALRETGISTFYTSIVLVFGFAIFTLSSFSGTIALGGLISCTLLFAMFANLLVLPALVLTFEKKKAIIEDIIETDLVR